MSSIPVSRRNVNENANERAAGDESASEDKLLEDALGDARQEGLSPLPTSRVVQMSREEMRGNEDREIAQEVTHKKSAEEASRARPLDNQIEMNATGDLSNRQEF